MLGETLAAWAVDRLGWSEVPRVPINPWPVAGVLVVFAGVARTQKCRFRVPKP